MSDFRDALSNLVPTTLSDAVSDSPTHLRCSAATFHEDHCTLKVYKTKTIQYWQRALENMLPLIPNLVLCPVSVLEHHLSQSAQTSQAPISGVSTSGGFQPLRGHHFAKFVKSCIAQIGLDPTQYSPHSFRQGGATFGPPPLFIKFLGDWSSDAYMVYLVLNSTQKLSIANTLAKYIPKIT